MTAAGLDLAPELKVADRPLRNPDAHGNPGTLPGRVQNRQPRERGGKRRVFPVRIRETARGVKLAPLTGSLLAGSVQGSLDLDWGEEVSLKGTIHGRNLNPAGISPDWAGVVNFDLAGSVAWPSQAPPRGEVSGRLLESRLHGQALTGELRADFARGDLHIGRLLLQGKGFDISAAGNLDKRLAFNAQIGDLGRLIPRTAGELRADGWVRWHDGRLDGSIDRAGREPCRRRAADRRREPDRAARGREGIPPARHRNPPQGGL